MDDKLVSGLDFVGAIVSERDPRGVGRVKHVSRAGALRQEPVITW